MTMIVAVDGTNLSYQEAGISNYIRNIMIYGVKNKEDLYFEVIVPFRLKSCIEHDRIIIRRPSFFGDRPNIFFRFFWFNFLLPCRVKRFNYDYFWAANGIIPFLLSHKNIVLTVYDLVPWNYPETMRVLARLERKFLFSRGLRLSRYILPISDTVRLEINDRFNLKIENFVYPGVHESFYTKDVNLENKGNYFIFVGTLEPRKNLSLLLKVVKRLVDCGLWPNSWELVIVGGQGWKMNQVSEDFTFLEVSGIVRRCGFVHESELLDYILNAQALLLPSLYEGFGIPIVEALALNTRVICSDIPIFREIGYSEGVLFHKLDEEGMFEVLRSFLIDGGWYFVNKNRAKYNWDRSSFKFIEVLEERI
jgi:glycosyltransferase involved in cell wall biosynthesis